MNSNAIETEVVENAIALRPQSEAAKTERKPMTAQELRTVEVSEALLPAYQKASTLELSNGEIDALMAPFPDEIVEIRPHDGLIFIPHIHISKRLNEVLKPGKWSLVCRRHWLEGITMYGEYVLVIRGCYVGESVGGHPYQPNNPKVNYSDTLESTAAEALRRIAGKRLSCGSQVWEPEYARQWVAKYAKQVAGKWVKVGSLTPTATVAPKFTNPRVEETTKVPEKPVSAQKQATVEQRDKMIAAIEKEGPDAVQRALGYFIEVGALLPNETLADVPLQWVPSTQGQFRELGVLIAKLNDTGVKEKPSWCQLSAPRAPREPNPATAFNPEEGEENPFNEADSRPATNPAKSAEKQPDLPKKTDSAPSDDEWFMKVIVPIPHKGQKRTDYLKDPDTIGSLFEARHDDEDARRRLFGFVSHFEPKPWTANDGKSRPPSKSDLDFRKALNAFDAWYQKNHDGEEFEDDKPPF